ncbi:N2227-like protein-domain-containing protein [Pseudomassariella vexata]|uniref:carnosine N-methyltransferase n=1 Tax=Pseudomassariella vexata TaxID=1141098 RepID=A0A1Y2EM12_9PEZI|nr:N2227-like protein-domain-containing protein [Pseudomassariella vexata]ORY71885.1 N2227-like protein-domain-containing protein [Pseudomassariella vexata]
MADQAGIGHGDDSQWNGVEDTIDDPEEIRVIFSALDSCSQYAKNAHLNCTHLRRQSFYALPKAHWEMLAQPPFSYLKTLDRVDDAIDSNAELARIICKFGLRSFGMQQSNAEGLALMPDEWAGIAKHQDSEKARSTIRQFYRDWSAEGSVEREASNGPVFRALDAEKARYPNRSPMNVLVPGAGLGRLVFDLCQKGYHSEGNEISYHQLLGSSYILNSVEVAGQHTIYPWIHSFSNHRNRENQFKSYRVPDIHPQTELAQTEGIGAMQMCAADFLCLYGDDAHKDMYDAVAAVFFLDTAPNLIRYLEVIRHCLKPGGVLINVGPLLWHFENNVPGHHGYDGEGDYDENHSLGIADPGSFELTDDEVMQLVERIGLVVEKRETNLRAPYVQDSQSMLQSVYSASHWVARKPKIQA